MSTGLQIEGLSVSYSHRAVAIESMDITVPEGTVAGILGANGAGKTTLLRAISGFDRIETGRIVAGSISYRGRRLTKLSADKIARAGVAIVPERDKIFATLTVEDNLVAVPVISSRANRRKRRDFVFDLFPAMAKMLNKQAGLLSGGERQMLALGRALLLEPTLLLADELSFGIAPVLVKRMMESLRVIHENEGISLLIVEQNAPAIFGIAHQIHVMEKGRMVREGPAEAIRDDPAVRAAFFGLDEQSGGER